jgi:hypothetical protein
MFTARLSSDHHTVLTFDGEVLELFRRDQLEAVRFHVSHIEKIELTRDRSGKYNVKLDPWVLSFRVDDDCLARAGELVAEVQKAMAAFRF